jgi:hypothetical protein
MACFCQCVLTECSGSPFAGIKLNGEIVWSNHRLAGIRPSHRHASHSAARSNAAVDSEVECSPVPLSLPKFRVNLKCLKLRLPAILMGPERRRAGAGSLHRPGRVDGKLVLPCPFRSQAGSMNVRQGRPGCPPGGPKRGLRRSRSRHHGPGPGPTGTQLTSGPGSPREFGIDPGHDSDRPASASGLRSGQVRYITRPKSRTMRATRQLMLPPSTVT